MDKHAKVIRNYLMERDGKRCHYCGCEIDTETADIEHLLPRSRFPEAECDMNNLVLACGTCNIQKGPLTKEEYINWLVLSSIDRDAGAEYICGLTAIGDAWIIPYDKYLC